MGVVVAVQVGPEERGSPARWPLPRLVRVVVGPPQSRRLWRCVRNGSCSAGNGTVAGDRLAVAGRRRLVADRDTDTGSTSPRGQCVS